MGDKTKRPTEQDIDALRKRVDATWCRIFEVKPIRNRDDFLEYQRQWHADLCVLDYAADRLKAEEEAERVPEVEAPEDAGDDGWIAWEGGECPVPPDTLVECDGRDGANYPAQPAHFFYWDNVGDPADIVRYRIVQPSQPPTDPVVLVGAMSNEEVEAALTGRGVGAWLLTDTTYGRHDRAWTGGPWAAIDINGACYANDPSRRMLSGPQGTTTTPEGRAECDRRLLVHLLREEQADV